MCFSNSCLIILHALISVHFALPFGVQGLAAVCDSGTSWAFLSTFLYGICKHFIK